MRLILCIDQCQSVAVRGLIRRGGTILVEYLPNHSIAFLPGGRVEPGETLKETLIRELKEELAHFDFEIGSYLGKIACFWERAGVAGSCLNHFFEVRILPATDCRQIEAAEPGHLFKWLALEGGEGEMLRPKVLPSLIGDHFDGAMTMWDLIDRQNEDF